MVIKIFISLIVSLLSLSNYFLQYSLAKNTSQDSNSSTKSIESNNYVNEDVYILGPGDLLKIVFFGDDALSGQYKILNNGVLTLPLIGAVNVSNLSLEQASDKIETLLKDELLIPEIDLMITQTRPVRVSIVGETQRPGYYSLTENESLGTNGSPTVNSSGMPTVLDALVKSGGVTKDANLREVILVRKIPGVGSEFKKTKLNLINLILEGDQSQNIYLFDGDVIRLNKADQTIDNIEIAAANISPEIINVRIYGEVENPGLLQLKSNTTLSQAILAAGGPLSWRSNKSNIQLIRINRNGSASQKKYSFKHYEGVSSNKNPLLQEGDIIRVNPTPLRKLAKGSAALSGQLRDVISIYTFSKIISD